MTKKAWVNPNEPPKSMTRVMIKKLFHGKPIENNYKA